MKQNKDSRSLVYGLLAVPLVAAAVWGGVNVYRDCKRTTAQAEYALET